MYKYLFEKFWFGHWYEKFGMVAVTACLLIVFIASFNAPLPITFTDGMKKVDAAMIVPLFSKQATRVEE
mgnify:CR=1 FL=1